MGGFAVRTKIMAKYLALGLSLSLTTAFSDSRADADILQSTQPIVSVYSIPSGIRFSKRRSVKAESATVYRFSLPLPPGAGTFDEKPACEKAQVRRKRVVYDSGKLNFFDMLVYDYRDASQTAKARDWDLPTVQALS